MAAPTSAAPAASQYPVLGAADIADATERLRRFAPYLALVFPETGRTLGIIESSLAAVPSLQQRLGESLNLSGVSADAAAPSPDRATSAGHASTSTASVGTTDSTQTSRAQPSSTQPGMSLPGTPLPGNLWLKLDSHLPISGSIKARGGIYEVLRHAESLALDAGMITTRDDYRRFADSAFTEFFARHSVSVGSTGNLGLSIGIMAAKLGFSTTVHMSADARQWKKDRLRHDGVEVLEHEGDYSTAVAAGRERAQGDPLAHFIDDENSPSLFLGYAVAAHRLKAQFEALDVVIDEEHPLFLHLPCGVGGGPGGITFGAKHAFGDAVHCVFVEPARSPSMLLGLASGLDDQIDVHAVGLDNVTAADGLACARPSGFVAHTVRHLVDACATVPDAHMFELLALLHDSEGIDIEPSSTVGIDSFVRLASLPADDPYRRRMRLTDERMSRATHVAWATGGSMVPAAEMAAYIARGR
ncbi:D-serine ammonia-lyase [Pseudoclavibacter sp. CFCC 13796]|uniref:D-serine ammonia-lyase n=1 Tax=Pseudoclavibacter sp. CFCC 13796 TaxID=2615179 RepID=UPI001300DD88|nr:D-serine ammonia-lyase [Pseudoclavibacter sp. CFCC 13796]KAB1660775.1 D-serine ammonia-lyase [Pseudoclavibacter sp. CFCC 13796]